MLDIREVCVSVCHKYTSGKGKKRIGNIVPFTKFWVILFIHKLLTFILNYKERPDVCPDETLL